MRFGAIEVWVALAVSLAPSVSFAQRRQQSLADIGRSQYDDLRYEEAIQTLSAAIIRRGNTPPQEIQIYELLAFSYLALNRNEEADGAFRQLLIRDPTHAVSQDLPPRFQNFLNQVRQRWEAEGRPGLQTSSTGQVIPVVTSNAAPVTIEHRSPAQSLRGRAVPLACSVTDPSHRVSRIVLAYRWASRGLFTRVNAQRDPSTGGFRATIPPDAVRPPLVEYYFEAVDDSGVPVQSRGDAFAPLRVAVPEGSGFPWGAVVAVGAVAVAAAVIIPVVIISTQSSGAHLTISITGAP